MALVEFNKAMKNCPCLAFNMIEHQSRQRPSESVQASVTGTAIMMLCLGHQFKAPSKAFLCSAGRTILCIVSLVFIR